MSRTRVTWTPPPMGAEVGQLKTIFIFVSALLS